jgi:Mg-chelatase subunit ChlI
MNSIIFPFSALVGQERMKSGLLLNAIDPSIGGVLISGHKGTGKSTAVRALAHILPEIEVIIGCPYNCSPHDTDLLCPACEEMIARGESPATELRPMPLVELPLSATEDRVIGTLHVEEILKSGTRRFEPGLLAAANRGILYVDEVNLLDDHLVDILLDAAASGVNVVEREGISHTHPARFMLVGTMNPEEGELRPQFLDRFGLSLQVSSADTLEERRSVVKRRLSFDTDPASFRAAYRQEDELLSKQITAARAQLARVDVPEHILEYAVRLAAEVKAQGHRADIGIVKTARALAAFLEADEVLREHATEAARFVLPHRITTLPLGTPELIEEKLEEVLKTMCSEAAETGSEKDPANKVEDAESWSDLSTQVPGATAASHASMMFAYLAEKKKLSSMQMN